MEDLSGKSVKILLIICVVLVVGLSLTIGMIMGNVMNKPNTLNTTNNTTPIVNTTVNQSQSTQTTTKKTESEEISASQAATIALKSAEESYPGAEWSVGSVDFVPAANYENTPNYMIELSNNAPDAENTTGTSMDVRVNVTNGAIME
jgi:cytoskeletal protein RodZ